MYLSLLISNPDITHEYFMNIISIPKLLKKMQNHLICSCLTAFGSHFPLGKLMCGCIYLVGVGIFPKKNHRNFLYKVKLTMEIYMLQTLYYP